MQSVFVYEQEPIESTLDERQRRSFAGAVENLKRSEDFYSENEVKQGGDDVHGPSTHHL